jgi:protein-S-isoprenylcysteine O-methyltransferase Ste14
MLNQIENLPIHFCIDGVRMDPSKRKNLGHIASGAAWVILLIFWLEAKFMKFPALPRPWKVVEVFLILQGIFFILLFVFRRPAERTSWKFTDLLFAFLGTFSPFLFQAAPRMEVSITGIVIEIAGCVLTLFSYASIGRSWGVIPAQRKIVSRGMYRWVRHPIYSSYQIFNIGFLINNPSVYNFGVALLCLLSQVIRISAEEKFLEQDPAYREFQKKVRWRLFPFVY